MTQKLVQGGCDMPSHTERGAVRIASLRSSLYVTFPGLFRLSDLPTSRFLLLGSYSTEPPYPCIYLQDGAQGPPVVIYHDAMPLIMHLIAATSLEHVQASGSRSSNLQSEFHATEKEISRTLFQEDQYNGDTSSPGEYPRAGLNSTSPNNESLNHAVGRCVSESSFQLNLLL